MILKQKEVSRWTISLNNDQNFQQFNCKFVFDHIFPNICRDTRARAYSGIYGKSNNHVIAAVPGLTFDINMVYSAVKVQSHNLSSRDEIVPHLKFGTSNDVVFFEDEIIISLCFEQN